MSFGNLRSLLSRESKDVYIEWYTLSNEIRELCLNDPDRFLGEFLQYVEDKLAVNSSKISNSHYHFRNGVKVPKDLDVNSVCQLNEVLNQSEFFRRLILDTTLAIRDDMFMTHEDFNYLLQYCGIFSGVSFYYVSSEEKGYNLSESIKSFKGFENVERLRVTMSDWDLISPIISNGKVESLEIYSVYRNHALFYEEIDKALNRLSLKKLKISGVRNLDLERILANLNGLEELDLSDNNIGNEGAILLSESQQLGGLKCLKLNNCSMGDRGVTALARAFNSTLSSLNSFYFFRNNFRYDAGGGRALMRSRLGEVYDPQYYIESDNDSSF